MGDSNARLIFFGGIYSDLTPNWCVQLRGGQRGCYFGIVTTPWCAFSWGEKVKEGGGQVGRCGYSLGTRLGTDRSYMRLCCVRICACQGLLSVCACADGWMDVCEWVQHQSVCVCVCLCVHVHTHCALLLWVCTCTTWPLFVSMYNNVFCVM